jgi:hypothetical protein
VRAARARTVPLWYRSAALPADIALRSRARGPRACHRTARPPKRVGGRAGRRRRGGGPGFFAPAPARHFASRPWPPPGAVPCARPPPFPAIARVFASPTPSLQKAAELIPRRLAPRRGPGAAISRRRPAGAGPRAAPSARVAAAPHTNPIPCPGHPAARRRQRHARAPAPAPHARAAGASRPVRGRRPLDAREGRAGLCDVPFSCPLIRACARVPPPQAPGLPMLPAAPAPCCAAAPLHARGHAPAPGAARWAAAALCA